VYEGEEDEDSEASLIVIRVGNHTKHDTSPLGSRLRCGNKKRESTRLGVAPFLQRDLT